MSQKIPADLMARCVAARAVVGDYRREAEQNPSLARVHVYWAPRLAAVLADVIDGVGLIDAPPLAEVTNCTLCSGGGLVKKLPEGLPMVCPRCQGTGLERS